MMHRIVERQEFASLFPSAKAQSVFQSVIVKLNKYTFYTFTVNPQANTTYRTFKTDVFGCLDEIELEKLRKHPLHYWVFNYCMEGMSYHDFNWYEFITKSAIDYNIPFHKIIFISSNILENCSYDEWREKYKINDKFYILSLNWWTIPFLGFDINKKGNSFTIDDTINNIRNNKAKYFLSLNRRLRDFRITTTFLLKQSKVFDRGLISANNPGKNYSIKDFWKNYFNDDFDESAFNNYLDTLPWVLDRSDFITNWAFINPYELYEQTLFSTVSETLHNDFLGTSLFYSEKSFKPMFYNHPVLIFGQPKANTYLKEIGFNTYDKYFDLSFDNISNPIIRLIKQINQLEKICDILDSLNTEGKIEWVLQDKETLLCNKEQLYLQDFNKSQFEKFIDYLEKSKDIK